jgi:hypothetical protein
MDGKLQNCCVPESFYGGSCVQDADCQGARYCTEQGFCAGVSGCEASSSGARIIYDKECVCAHIGEFCSYSHGIPCADGCALWKPAPTLTVCARLDVVGSNESVFPLA